MGIFSTVLAALTFLNSPLPFTPKEVDDCKASEQFKRVLNDPVAMHVVRQLALNEDILLAKDDPWDALLPDNPEKWLFGIHQDYCSCKGCPRLIDAKRFTMTVEEVKSYQLDSYRYQAYCKEQQRLDPEGAPTWAQRAKECKKLDEVYATLRVVINQENRGAVRRAALKVLKEKLPPDHWANGPVPKAGQPDK